MNFTTSVTLDDGLFCQVDTSNGCYEVYDREGGTLIREGGVDEENEPWLVALFQEMDVLC